MDTVSPDRQCAFEAALLSVCKAVASVITTKTARTKDSHWRVWCAHCQDFNIDPHLRCCNPIPCLQAFGQLCCDGIMSPSKRPVRADTVSNALCSVGQAFLRVGKWDPWLSQDNKLDF